MLAALAALVATSACSSEPKKEDTKKAPAGSLTRNFELIDSKDGMRYGNVEMDPIGGGKVFDADGRLIGNIVPPPPGGYAPAYAPPPPPPQK